MNEFGFTGRYHDAETGLMYFRARMYSPGLGRFVSRDPIGYVDGYLLYGAYFIPNQLDPSGLSRFTDCVDEKTKASMAKGVCRERADDRAVRDCLQFADDGELRSQERIDQENGDTDGPAIRERQRREQRARDEQARHDATARANQALRDSAAQNPSPSPDEDGAPSDTGPSDTNDDSRWVPPALRLWLEDTVEEILTIPGLPGTGEAVGLLDPDGLQGLFFDIPNYVDRRDRHIFGADNPSPPNAQPRWSSP